MPTHLGCVSSVLLAIRHSVAVKASCRRSSAHYRVAGAAGLPERSVFANASAGGGQGRCRLINIISYSSCIRWIFFARPFDIAKSPTVPRTITTMATLSSDHDDYRIGLNTPLQPTSDNTNWDPTASYAELLYQVLKNAPDKTIKLYDIYNWF